MFRYSGFMEIQKDSDINLISNFIIENIIKEMAENCKSVGQMLDKINNINIEIHTGKHPITENHKVFFYELNIDLAKGDDTKR